MIAIIEDDTDIREMESYALCNSGFEVREYEQASTFFSDAGEVPELVLLDIMLPGEDGLSVLRRLREDARLCKVPVIMVTAKTSELDRVRGLDMGADDYIVKPFGIRELVSRVRALLRRTRPEAPPVLICGEIELNESARQVKAGGASVVLTFKEYELLKYLMNNKGIVLSRERLIEAVWGYDFLGETRTVDMHIKTLRQKLGVQGRQIRTFRNVGYMLGV